MPVCDDGFISAQFDTVKNRSALGKGKARRAAMSAGKPTPWTRIIPGIVLATLLAVFGILGWKLTRSSEQERIPSRSGPGPAANAVVRAEIRIKGMDCLMCAAGLQNQLRSLPGVSSAEVSYQDQRAVIEFEPARIDRAKLEKTILAAGFQVADDAAPP
jgi:copper chaperone